MKTKTELLKELAAKWIDEDRFLYPRYANKCAIEVLALLALPDDTVSVTPFKDPTGFSIEMMLDEANHWTKRGTGKQMILNYAALIAAHLESLK